MYFASHIYSTGDNLAKLFKGESIDSSILDEAYNKVKNVFLDKKAKLILRARVLEEGSIRKKAELKKIDDINFTLENFDNNKVNSVRALHQKYMEQYNLKFIETDDFNENSEKGKDATQLWALS